MTPEQIEARVRNALLEAEEEISHPERFAKSGMRLKYADGKFVYGVNQRIYDSKAQKPLAAEDRLQVMLTFAKAISSYTHTVVGAIKEDTAAIEAYKAKAAKAGAFSGAPVDATGASAVECQTGDVESHASRGTRGDETDGGTEQE